MANLCSRENVKDGVNRKMIGQQTKKEMV
jgi:hypothetical protein